MCKSTAGVAASLTCRLLESWSRCHAGEAESGGVAGAGGPGVWSWKAHPGRRWAKEARPGGNELKELGANEIEGARAVVLGLHAFKLG